MDQKLYTNNLEILKDELIMALGCTEPIAGGLKGIDVAAVLGIVGGDPDMDLAVLESVTKEDQEKTKELLNQKFCTCKLIEGVATLYIVVELRAGEHTALVEIQKTHKNITLMEKDGMSVLKKTEADEENGHKAGDKQLLTVNNILEFAVKVKFEDVEEILNRQIECNMAICREGLEHPYGAEVGRILIDGNEKPTVGLKARAFAAAGSDARMNGCPMPVVINSGSGNQGITVSVPFIVYAKEKNIEKEKLLRGLVVSNLIAVHQKKYIGSLSAYCGEVSAA